MIDGKNVFYQAVKNDKITHENIRKINLVNETIAKQVVY